MEEVARHKGKRVLVGEFAGAAGTLSSLGKDGLKVQEALMAELELGQPEIAWWWFPSNDHPSDKATFDVSVAVPDADLAAAEHGVVPVTYVPFRNAHFLAAAVSWAEVLGASRIFIGAVEQDSSGYPDCRPAY